MIAWQVPGIGPAIEAALNRVGITTTFQLFAKFLMFKEKNIGPIEHLDRFYFWLKEVVPAGGGQRAGTVHAIATKTTLQYPGLYDPTAYSDEDYGDA